MIEFEIEKHQNRQKHHEKIRKQPIHANESSINLGISDAVCSNVGNIRFNIQKKILYCLKSC